MSSTEKGVLEEALWPRQGKKAKCGGVQSASAHFFHFDEGGIRAVYVEEGRRLMLSEKLQFMPGMGRLFSGGTAYAIGGKALRGSPHPREVWICDMNGPRGPVEEGYAYVLAAAPVGVDVYPWQRGPDLIGPKPSPLVFAFRGMIYALSGGGATTTNPESQEDPPPLFEVLDPEEEPPSWKQLPNPPDSMYHRSPIPSWSHLVLGNRLWVCARHACARPGCAAADGEDITFCFDLIEREWVSVPYSERPDGVQALCGSWPIPPHAVGGDIHYHAVTDENGSECGYFYAVTAEGRFVACKAHSLISSLRNAERVLFESPPDFGTGFTEAILYPPETEEEGDAPVFRMLLHYQSRRPLFTEFGGAPWGTLVLLTFSLNGKDASHVSSKLWCLPHQTAAIGGRPSILFKAYYH
ncbi:hypothetical protein Tsubulata_038508 [Turnera subulata]|uniref:Uncharacterized protein n=1 Tax=Turnera subulata TaxID=218843 RepID=A0A9Q0F9B7_9ROSI|nr:hypothetical protein Tsubulata_038508 [Turnera subulata]